MIKLPFTGFVPTFLVVLFLTSPLGSQETEAPSALAVTEAIVLFQKDPLAAEGVNAATVKESGPYFASSIFSRTLASISL